MVDKVSLALLIHAHQPVGNFDHVIEEAYRKSYRPFAEALLAHPSVRLSLHYSGVLLEWLEARHPEFFDLLRKLGGRRQVELVGGGFYEPILLAIPERDRQAQLRRLSDFLVSKFGTRPRGAWLAERVWEPSLAKSLAEAGVEYLALDDTHFLAAGLDPADLHGPYVTEETGSALRLVPSLKSLRYAIPFREPAETLGILREGQGLASRLFAMGDDCEKFGVWPGTYDHCYTNGWLERFLGAIESASDWLATTTVSDYLAGHPPLGRIYLPTASYEEMMEWALPAAASRELKSAREESERMPNGVRFRRFMRGGIWQNFLAKYSEGNQIHKLMLEVSRRLDQRLARTPPKSAPQLLDEAESHLLAAQCNDAYWHGVFGGLYAPHLRSALLRHLIRTEVLLDRLEPAAKAVRFETTDFDADGREEILVQHPRFGMVVRPADGGTVSSLRFKPCDVELINSLMRRYEPYHDLVRQRISSGEAGQQGPSSIHARVWSKEPNLSALLRYDRYARHAFRLYLFPASKQLEDFDYLRLQEVFELAAGPWSLAGALDSGRGAIRLERKIRLESNELRAAKTLRAQARQSLWELECSSELAFQGLAAGGFALGLEVVLNLLAPDAPHCFFEANGQRRPLEFKGEFPSGELRVTDRWQQVRVTLRGEPAPRWWIVPIETISQSEAGFERVYQGSAILAVWRFPKSLTDEFACTLGMLTETLR